MTPAILIRHCRGNTAAWGAFTPSGFTVATAMSLDTLVDILTERHGPLVLTIDTSGVAAQPGAPVSRRAKAAHTRKTPAHV